LQVKTKINQPKKENHLLKVPKINVPHRQAPEGQLAEEHRVFLVLADLPEREGSRDGSGARGFFTPPVAGPTCAVRRLGRQLLPRRLAAGGLPCRLLRAGHQDGRREAIGEILTRAEIILLDQGNAQHAT
jgi:hypothetical protein